MSDCCVREFTRHAGDLLLNLQELRLRGVLTDVALLAGGTRFLAHKTVLVACSQFFYCALADQRVPISVLPLPGVEPSALSILLDFMYTSRLLLGPDTAHSVLSAAHALNMDHVVAACSHFLQFGVLSHSHYPREGVLLPPQVQRTPLKDLLDIPVCLVSPATSTSNPRFSNFGTLGVPVQHPRHSPPPKEVCDSLVECGTKPLEPAEVTTTDLSMCCVNNQGEEACKTLPQVALVNSGVGTKSGVSSVPPKSCNWKKQRFLPRGDEQVERELGTNVEEKVQHEGTSSTGNTLQLMIQSPSSGRKDNANSELSQTNCLDHLMERLFKSSLDEDSSSQHCSLVPSGTTFQEMEVRNALPRQHQDDGRDRAQIACGTCGLVLPKEPGLKRYTRRHASTSSIPDKPYKCETCHATFRYKGNLSSHKTVHSGEKPYRCNVCSAQFNRPANLKTHARIHSGEKPYKCNTCEARFVQVAHLRAHVLIHTGEKPYPCDTCGTRFRHLQTLKSHVRIHTGEKPYHCESCELHFRHKSQLRLHLRQKHGAVTNTKRQPAPPPPQEPEPPPLQPSGAQAEAHRQPTRAGSGPSSDEDDSGLSLNGEAGSPCYSNSGRSSSTNSCSVTSPPTLSTRNIAVPATPTA
uniref:B-cell CLL/lymphoma 6 member B protein-like n=1 Tax=Myxine glutinosa TaxID=7769 RepID=UPI00358DE46A